MNGFDTSEHNSNSGQTLHISAKRPESLNNSFETSVAQAQTHVTSSSVSSSSTDRMRSGSGEPQLHSGISSTTPIWTSPGNAYDFDSYPNQHNGTAASSSSSSCCMSAGNGSNGTHSHHPLPPPPSSGAGSYYYASATPDASTTRPCKPAPTKFWSNSAYDAAVNGPTAQMPNDSIVAAAVCHGSAFAAAAAHHAAANHVAAAASAWCNYSPYHQTARADPYLTGETDHRTAFVDSYHPAIRNFTTVGADQGCSGTSVGGWNQTPSGAPPPTTATGKYWIIFVIFHSI
jgi:hypothetical protein